MESQQFHVKIFMGKIIYLRKEGGKMCKQEKDNLLQFAKMVLFFCNSTDQKLYKTKLNKLLFYAQFQHYKEHSEKLLENEFKRDHYGPVLDNLDDYLNILQDARIVNLETNIYGVAIIPVLTLEEKEYNKKELSTLRKIHRKFKNYSAKQISDYSHEESLWKDTVNKKVIPINRAKELMDF